MFRVQAPSTDDMPTAKSDIWDWGISSASVSVVVDVEEGAGHQARSASSIAF
uniref:Uncharacterized protein n=1 Tax=Pseudomonas fluorescens (strain SBW25) TaxID=216595 RepID=A0A0G4E4P8_PSEFS|nr:hypothetical protein PQBR57_0262 [Pseudomonas fluorescens SBW25]